MPTSAPLTLDQEGHFRCAQQRVFLAGVNYWPASSGLRMWNNWSETEIAADLDLIRTLGLNAIRFFLRWQDFEPTEGRYDERQFARLEWLLRECANRGLWAQPSLFVGWMSGGIFWPDWKRGRNLYTDPELRQRAAEFARRAAVSLSRHPSCLANVDLGNEMTCLPDSEQAGFADIASWCERVCGEIKALLPGVPIVSGCDMGQVIKDTPWAFGNQPGTDLYSIHAYPVTNWNPVPMGGLDDPLSRRLFAYYCAYARAYGPTLLQEFGTILTLGKHQSEEFLAASLPATAAEGVNGMLWWCLHDIRSLEHPYAYCEMERSLGLIDRRGRLKPGLAAAVRQLAQWAAHPESLPQRIAPDTFLYLPEENHTRNQSFLRHPNPQRLLGPRYLMAWHLLAEAGRRPGFARATELPTPGTHPVLFCGSTFSPVEIARLQAWVQAGGRLVIHGVSARNWGETLSAFLGAKAVDYALNTEYTVSWGDTVWTIPRSPEEVRIVVEPQSAEVLARDSDGNPCILRQHHGLGHITYCLPSPEDAASRDRGRSLASGDRWQRWLTAMLAPARTAELMSPLR
jgi:hypothetical protein